MENIKLSNKPKTKVLHKGYKLQQDEVKIKNGINPFVIKNNVSSIVRLNLKWDDIYNNGLIESEIVYEVVFKGKKVYLFRQPFHIPNFSQYYAQKVESSDNYYLEELVEMLLFLNPNPDYLMRKKITECILQKFTLQEKVKSVVKLGQFTTVPVLTNEEVRELVEFKSQSDSSIRYKPQHKEIVMYGSCHLEKGEKIAFKCALRMREAKMYYKKAIKKAINVLIENYPDVKISFAQLESVKLIKKFNTNEYAKAGLIRNVITFRDKRIITNHNDKAIFNKISQKEKFNKFCLMDNPTLDSIVEHCNISKRDAIEFRRLRQK